MITEDQAMTLLIESNPVPDIEQLELVDRPGAAYLATLEMRSSEMAPQGLKETDSNLTETAEHRRRWLVAVALFVGVVAVVAVGLTLRNSSNQVDPVDDPVVPTPTTVVQSERNESETNAGFPADLTGTYMGSAIYEEANGAPHDRLTYMLELTQVDGEISGFLSHANAQTPGFRLGRGYMPVLVTRDGTTLDVLWDDSVGFREDTTPSQCTVLEISLTLSVSEDPEGLEIVDGRWVAGGDDPSEFDEECHNHGVPIHIRGILQKVDSPPEIPDFTPATLG